MVILWGCVFLSARYPYSSCPLRREPRFSDLFFLRFDSTRREVARQKNLESGHDPEFFPLEMNTVEPRARPRLSAPSNANRFGGRTIRIDRGVEKRLACRIQIRLGCRTRIKIGWGVFWITHCQAGATLEATQGQMDGLLSQLPYKSHLEEVASVRD